MAIPHEIAERLQAHVGAIVAAAGIPAADRSDVAEELYGHLAERWAHHLAEGLDPQRAAERAIAEFGRPDQLGRDFLDAYHSRFWASTVGVLLPATDPTDAMPGVVRWTALGGSLVAVVSVVLGTVGALTFPPVAALLTIVAMGAGAAVVWLGAEALRRGQAWGLTVVTLALLAHAATLVTTASHPNGGTNLSLNGLVALVLLLRLGWSGPVASAWVRGSSPLPGRLKATLAVTMIAWTFVPYTALAVPDPTQAGPDDIRVVASVRCGPDAVFDEMEDLIVVRLDVTWDVVDVAPKGLARLEDWGDAVYLQFADSRWLPGGPRLTDAETGEPLDQNGAWGLTLHPRFRQVESDAGIEAHVMRPGRTVRLEIPAHGPGDLDELPNHVEILYAHRDRFILKTALACGGSGTLVPEEVFDRAEFTDLMTGEIGPPRR